MERDDAVISNQAASESDTNAPAAPGETPIALWRAEAAALLARATGWAVNLLALSGTPRPKQERAGYASARKHLQPHLHLGRLFAAVPEEDWRRAVEASASAWPEGEPHDRAQSEIDECDLAARDLLARLPKAPPRPASGQAPQPSPVQAARPAADEASRLASWKREARALLDRAVGLAFWLTVPPSAPPSVEGALGDRAGLRRLLALAGEPPLSPSPSPPCTPSAARAALHQLEAQALAHLTAYPGPPGDAQPAYPSPALPPAADGASGEPPVLPVGERPPPGPPAVSPPSPATPPAPKRRAVNLEQLQKRQSGALERFFSPGDSARKQERVEHEPWQAWLELDGPGEGGRLVFVMAALTGLRSFVKQLTIVSAEGEAVLTATNAASGATRTEVLPAASGYRVDAGEHQEDYADELAPLALDGLSTERATVFAVRTDGRAERTATPTLAPGKKARVLVPPSLSSVALPEGAWPVGAGHRAFELELLGPPRGELALLLTALGLEAGEASLSLSWSGPAPVRRARGRAGEAYPCFLSEPPPALTITRDGLPVSAVVSLSGASPPSSLSLPPDPGPVTLALSQLAPGPYVLDVVTELPGLAERLFFAIDEHPPLPPPARAELTCDGEPLDCSQSPVLERDFSLLSSPPASLSLPPLWRVDVYWRGVSRRWLGSLHADQQGNVSPEQLSSLASSRLASSDPGDLVLDAGPLGHATLRHDPQPDPGRALAGLESLWHERSSAIASSAGDPALVLDLWLAPACQLLGYRPGKTLPFPGGLALELHTSLRDGARVVPGPKALAVALREGLTPGQPPGVSAVKQWREALVATGASRALLATAGAWVVVDRDRRMVPAAVGAGSDGWLKRLVEGAYA